MIVKVAEIADARHSVETEKGVRHTRGWIVESDSVKDGSPRILSAPKIPRRGDAHPQDGSAIATQREATFRGRSGNPWVWDVRVDYERSFEDPAGGGGGNGGEAQFPEVRFGSQSASRHTDEDWFGNPLMNSAAQRFADSAEVGISLTTMEISATVPFDLVTTALLDGWRDVVHGPQVHVRDRADIRVAGFPKFFDWAGLQVKFESIQAEMTRPNPRSVMWRVRLPFLIADSWLELFRDEGTHQADVSFEPGASPGRSGTPFKVSKTRIILDDHGLPVNRPVMLNGQGKPLADGKAVFLPYQMHKHRDLNNLLLHLKLPLQLSDYKILSAAKR